MVLFLVEQSFDNDINMLLTQTQLYPGSGSMAQISNMKASVTGFASIVMKPNNIRTYSIQLMARNTPRIILGSTIKYIRMLMLLPIEIHHLYLLRFQHLTLLPHSMMSNINEITST